MTTYPAHWSKARKAHAVRGWVRLVHLFNQEELTIFKTADGYKAAIDSISALWARQDAEAAVRLQQYEADAEKAMEKACARLDEGDTCPSCGEGQMAETVEVYGSIRRKGPLTCSACRWEKGDHISSPNIDTRVPCPRCQAEINADAVELADAIALKAGQIEQIAADLGIISPGELGERHDNDAWHRWNGLQPIEQKPRQPLKIPPTEHTAPEITRAMEAMTSCGGHLLGSKNAFGDEA